MFGRLFGETEQEQMQYLQKRVFITAGCLMVDIIGLIIAGSGGLMGIMAYVWGWRTIRAFFGVATIGVVFSRNVVLGTVIFVVFLLLGGLVGMVNMFLGIGRFIYLKVKWAKQGGC